MSDSNPLLNNSSVQGAAKHIEGLMDTKGVINKSQEEEAQVEPKEEAKAETKVEQKPEAQQEETQEATVEEEASEDENAIEEQTTDLHQVTVNVKRLMLTLKN